MRQHRKARGLNHRVSFMLPAGDYNAIVRFCDRARPQFTLTAFMHKWIYYGMRQEGILRDSPLTPSEQDDAAESQAARDREIGLMPDAELEAIGRQAQANVAAGAVASVCHLCNDTGMDCDDDGDERFCNCELGLERYRDYLADQADEQ